MNFYNRTKKINTEREKFLQAVVSKRRFYNCLIQMNYLEQIVSDIEPIKFILYRPSPLSIQVHVLKLIQVLGSEHTSNFGWSCK